MLTNMHMWFSLQVDKSYWTLLLFLPLCCHNPVGWMRKQCRSERAWCSCSCCPVAQDYCSILWFIPTSQSWLHRLSVSCSQRASLFTCFDFVFSSTWVLSLLHRVNCSAGVIYSISCCFSYSSLNHQVKHDPVTQTEGAHAAGDAGGGGGGGSAVCSQVSGVSIFNSLSVN